MNSKDDITLKTILEHMRVMEDRLLTEIQEVRSDLGATEARLNTRIDRMEHNLTTQIDGLDRRLDDIEVSQIPQLKKVVGMS